MVHIVAGAINSGKTTKLQEIFKKCPTGDGFILSKNFHDGHNIGQQILRLSTGEHLPFSYRIPYLPCNWDHIYTYKDYSFSRSGFAFAASIIYELIEKKVSPVFMDEIGPLELMGTGFHDLFKNLLKMNGDIYIAVRETLLHNVMDHFRIIEPEILKIGSF